MKQKIMLGEGMAYLPNSHAEAASNNMYVHVVVRHATSKTDSYLNPCKRTFCSSPEQIVVNALDSVEGIIAWESLRRYL